MFHASSWVGKGQRSSFDNGAQGRGEGGEQKGGKGKGIGEAGRGK